MDLEVEYEEKRRSSVYKIDRMKTYRTIIVLAIVLLIILTLLLTGILLAVKSIQTSEHELATIFGTGPRSKASAPDFRLPKHLVPYYYDIHIYTNFYDDQQPNDFNGTCKIFFECKRSTKRIIFHGKSLDIQNSTIEIVDLGDTRRLAYSSLSYDKPRQLYIVELIDALRASQNYSVFIKYGGLLRDDTAGFYRASYLDSQMNKRWILASQMQPTDARKGFPCFDEPWMKARFKLTVDHHKSYSALSNMPSLSTRETSYDSNLTETTFEESIPMSTYLVALIISDFKCKYATANAGVSGTVNVSVCGKADVYDQLDFSLANLVSLLEYYEERFGLKYPLSKCDNVGLPDFLYLGMENFGLITYRETHLFVHDTNTTSSQMQKRQIHDVLVHEIVHIWFGNIVTPEWWDDLWLSEGFATYIQLESYSMMLLNSLFQMDSLSNSYSVYMEIKKPSDTEQIFNEMTYLKASIVVRLLKLLVGEKMFDKIVLAYLQRHQNSFVNQYDLYNVIQEEIQNENSTKQMPAIRSYFQSWIGQNGHPVVHVSRLNSSAIVLTQERFLIDPSVVEDNEKHKWYISFTYDIKKCGQLANSNETAAMAKLHSKARKTNITWMLPEDEKKIEIMSHQLDESSFIIGNIELSGFYRVNYDLENWSKILKQLKLDPLVIAYENRVQIINDMLSFGRNGILDVTHSLEILDYLKNETDSYLWRIAIHHLREIFNMLQSTDTLKDYQNYLYKIFNSAYSNLHSNDSKHNESEIIGALFPFACELGFKDCIDLSKTMFTLAQRGDNTTGNLTNLPEFILCNGIKYGTRRDWDTVLNLHDVGQNDDLLTKKTLQHALSCTRDVKLLERYLNDQINETKTKRYDCLHGINSAARSSHASLWFVWSFIKNNWSYLYHRFGHSNIIEFNHFISSITDGFHTEEMLNDFIKFFKENPDHESISRQVRQSIEKIQSVIKWRKRNSEKLSTWLKTKV